MITLHVAQLLKESAGATRAYTFEEPLENVDSDLKLLAPVSGRAEFLRTARGILVSARYGTTAELECGRCLDPARFEVSGDFQEEFVPRIDIMTGLPSAEQAESAELVINEHHELDLTEVIRQDLLTRLPLQPLCRPDCPGLCPECGAELGRGACDCRQATVSGSPFAALGDLLGRASADEGRG